METNNELQRSNTEIKRGLFYKQRLGKLRLKEAPEVLCNAISYSTDTV